MPKRIKFNLLCDNYPARTLDDLKENFSIEDVLEYYHSGLLQRWLDVRGMVKELESVNLLKTESDSEAITELIKIFGVEYDSDMVKEQIYSLEYTKSRQARIDILTKNLNNGKEIVNNYFNAYTKIIDDIEYNCNDLPFIKSAVKEIEENYFEIFEYSYRNFYWQLVEKAPLAVFAALMRHKLRPFFIPEGPLKSEESLDKVIFNDKRAIYEDLCKFDLLKLPENSIKKYIKDKETAYWDFVERDGQFLILNIPKKAVIGDFEVKGSGYTDAEVNGYFLILNGIAYNSTDLVNPCIYMVV
ncbi:MAG: hypothetical protein LBK52_03700 [Deltaproteobacteria bacterium]|jgi:hypothetical protein|nr:hypothetical protein [Deltaproteobacteria bacterium]